ncbi:hypothetical protein BU26DRAFT_28041 [Trematosphaeria pertusa]|uniref:Uncharacterized protein n=1 Tax=Trematosphaeria pertusa TaxID=390896 RepID=A0A6A6J1P7_9PLEO|nr:uncharacterized protein BU26DRAFT_28041 [Trematosphaeria pertusa]KAF2256714.1 hypothetical protein BU26DRAFT_28041 [Trematosphaeria pertusa]
MIFLREPMLYSVRLCSPIQPFSRPNPSLQNRPPFRSQLGTIQKRHTMLYTPRTSITPHEKKTPPSHSYPASRPAMYALYTAQSS